MGYHSSPLVTFFLALFNVRLGTWLGNPGFAGDKTYHRAHPGFSLRTMIAEIFGLTNESSPYVYLSDGGHFDNLGLYEMIVRRCAFIVVIDAGEDPDFTFTDLGRVVRKIRIDLGIGIEFPDPIMIMRPDNEENRWRGRNCAIGRIRYSAVDGHEGKDGVIVYIKPACYGNEPRDIQQYAEGNPSFPHQATSNQFFTESQFESYRMLGVHIMQNLCPTPCDRPRDFVRNVCEYLGREAPSWLQEALHSRADASERLKNLDV
jgi:hypothetical protein